MEHVLRLFDFNVYNDMQSTSEDGTNVYKDTSSFTIQMFGVDEKGKTYSLTAEGFCPFFYLMVDDNWNIKLKEEFLYHLKVKMGSRYEDSITKCKIIKRKKLYGFDGGKEYKFIFLEFANLNAFNKAKNLWYSDYKSGHNLLKNGYKFKETNILLYEANIPPLLRFFHIRDISPSGWVAVPKKKGIEYLDSSDKMVNCDYIIKTDYKNIIPLNEKETRVPYKIMSFDIEASSSHGDFPVPVKTYKKLTTNIIEYFENLKMDITKELCKNISTNHVLVKEIDKHIMENINNLDYKPATGFNAFCKNNIDIYKNEAVRLIQDYNMSDYSMIHDKIKKTYKNRYYIIIKKNVDSCG